MIFKRRRTVRLWGVAMLVWGALALAVAVASDDPGITPYLPAFSLSTIGVVWIIQPDPLLRRPKDQRRP